MYGDICGLLRAVFLEYALKDYGQVYLDWEGSGLSQKPLSFMFPFPI